MGTVQGSILGPIPYALFVSQIIKSNYLYIDVDIWLPPSLSHHTKKYLLNVTAAPLKLCCFAYDNAISYERLHTMLRCLNCTMITITQKMPFLKKLVSKQIQKLEALHQIELR